MISSHWTFTASGVVGVRRGEDMRVPADHLARDRLDDVAEIEGALFLRHARMEDDLQEQVAEFVAEIGKIAALDRVGHLIGLFERIGLDRLECLPDVPRAAGFGLAQGGHDLDQASNVA